MPVAVTTAVARPAVITVEPMTAFLRSPRAVSGGRETEGSFSTGTDSPVMADSSALREADSSSRASAGTRSPASRRMRSPGTNSPELIRCSLPSRTTRARGADSSRRAARAFWALFSWEMEMAALTTTISRMMTLSSQSSPPEEKRLNPAAASSTRIMGSLSWSSRRRRRFRGGASESRLGPYFASRRSASAADRPRRRSVFRAERVSARLLLCQGSIKTSPFFVMGYLHDKERTCPITRES